MFYVPLLPLAPPGLYFEGAAMTFIGSPLIHTYAFDTYIGVSVRFKCIL